jgi:hypothetical protein
MLLLQRVFLARVTTRIVSALLRRMRVMSATHG